MLSTVGVCLVYTAACAAIGAALMPVIGIPRVKWREYSAAALLATVLLLGQGLLASVWLILGLAEEFSLPLIVGLLGLCLLIGVAVVRRELGDLSRRLWVQMVDHLSGLQTPVRFVAVLALLVVALLGTFNAILPVRFGAGDGIAFYMVLAKVMAASQRVVPVSGHEHNHGVSGFLGEMHHAALLALHGEQAALLFVWLTTTSMLAVLVALCGCLGVGRVGKWVAVVMMLSSTAVSFYLIDGKVDLFAAAMGVAALYWALQVERGGGLTPAVCLAGLFTGFAVVAKATYALAVALPVVALLFWRARESRFLVSLWLPFVLFALLPFGPHAAKNILFFGEPFAPFFFLDPQAGVAYRSQGSSYPPSVVRQMLLTYPFSLAYGDYTFQYGHISGLYIALGPLALLVPVRVWRRRENLVRFTLIMLMTVIVAAVLLASRLPLRPRLTLPAFLALIPAISFAAEYVFHASVAHAWFRGVMAGCLCIAMIGYSTLEQDFKRMVRYKIHGSGICDVEGFPLPECHDMLALNELAGRGERINISWNDYKYWLRADLIQCLASREEQGLSGGASENWENLYDHGFRFVENAGDPWNLTQVPEGLQVSLVYSREATGLSQAVQLYELGSSDLDRAPSVGCRQVNPPAWSVVRED